MGFDLDEFCDLCATLGRKCHTQYGMKMTIRIDEDLLDRVIERFGFASKTEAVEMALREMDRKARFREFAKAGLGLSAEELKGAVDPDYEVAAMRVAERSAVYCSGKAGESSR